MCMWLVISIRACERSMSRMNHRSQLWSCSSRALQHSTPLPSTPLHPTLRSTQISLCSTPKLLHSQKRKKKRKRTKERRNLHHTLRVEIRPIRSNISIGSDMDVIARLGISDNGSNPLSQSIPFYSTCAAHITSCYGAHDYMQLQATLSMWQQQQ